MFTAYFIIYFKTVSSREILKSNLKIHVGSIKIIMLSLTQWVIYFSLDYVIKFLVYSVLYSEPNVFLIYKPLSPKN